MYSPEAFDAVCHPPKWEIVSLDEAERRRYVDFVFTDGWKMFDRRLWNIRCRIKSRITAPALTSKVELHRLLLARAPDLVPETYIIEPGHPPVMPDESVPWIYRPDERAGGGRGISVVTSLAHLQRVHQEYLDTPLVPEQELEQQEEEDDDDDGDDDDDDSAVKKMMTPVIKFGDRSGASNPCWVM